MAMDKLSREASEATNPVDMLILDFQPPELRRNESVLFQPAELWYSVMAAGAD